MNTSKCITWNLDSGYPGFTWEFATAISLSGHVICMLESSSDCHHPVRFPLAGGKLLLCVDSHVWFRRSMPECEYHAFLG